MPDAGDQLTQKTDFTLTIPPDLDPADALEVVIGLCFEMRHSLNKLESLVKVMNNQELRAIHEDAAQDAQEWVGGLNYILNIIYAYDKQRLE